MPPKKIEIILILILIINIINYKNNKMQSNNNNNTNNSITNNRRPVSIYIKEANTETRKEYLVFTDWTVQQLAHALSPQIARDFNVERDRFNLIPYGQEAAEEGISINRFRYRGFLLRQIWNSELDMGFYLKRIEDIDLTNED
jgi:hypothetical protein